MGERRLAAEAEAETDKGLATFLVLNSSFSLLRLLCTLLTSMHRVESVRTENSASIGTASFWWFLPFSPPHLRLLL